MTDLLEVVALALIVASVFLALGPAAALFVAGVALLLVSRGVEQKRAKRTAAGSGVG